MNKAEVKKSKRGKYYVMLTVGERKFVQTLRFFETKAEAEALLIAVTSDAWYDGTVIY